jgi:hypothetical protein
MKESDACHYLIFYYNQKVLFVKEVNWKYFLLGANVVDDLAFSVKSLIIVVYSHKTSVIKCWYFKYPNYFHTFFFSSWVVIKLWSLTGFPRASLHDLDVSMSVLCFSFHDLDVSMSVLCFQKDNLLSLTNVCKMYILNKKQIRTNCISRKVWDDRFWKIIIDCCWKKIIDRFSIIIDDEHH